MSAIADVVIQIVRVSWTKASRGAEGAAARRAAPLGLVLPDELTTASFHQVVFDETDAFTPESRRLPSELLDDRIRIDIHDAGPVVRVGPLFGFTYRGYHPSVRLRPGRWVRWLQNARWTSATGHGDWRYTAETVNVAIAPVELGVFMGEPDKVIDERVSLR
ncbi:hypothetical protein [Myceligenerans xiligouense]|uniref:Uncharacterized protein n=1 Tax=Myceligenerans xiligouense TaxID=253184 RepID=A0A3N4ZMU6_9MICO|nr:hypothetical protein [Myceligenerans xiligouense]RPF22245.1 hypothetical protein EDD34_2895 [Myceligenerans xiligouense]